MVIIRDGNENGNGIVRLHFSNGDLIEKEGDLDKLGDNLKVIIKST